MSHDHERDQWCPECRCAAGRYKGTYRHNRNHPVRHHYQCRNCGHHFAENTDG